MCIRDRLLCFDSLYPPFRQQFLVELLQMQRRQIIQRDLAELRLDVVFDVAMVGDVYKRQPYNNSRG